MDWQSFDNNLSVKFDASRSKILSTMNDTTSSETLDFLFPFKVVTLEWLISIGKFVQIYIPNDVVNVYKGVFNSDDKYINVGAVCTPFRTPTQNVYVLLVYNSDSYRTIKQSNFQTPVGDGINVYFTYSQYTQNDFVDGYTQLGTNIGDKTKNEGVVYVKNDYCYKLLAESDNVPVRLCYFMSIVAQHMDYDGMFQYMALSTMFNNILLSQLWWGNSSSYTPANFIMTYPTSQNFIYDIVPGQILADCCNNTINNQLPKELCTNYSSKTDSCQQYMNNFCKNDNLQTEACYNFCSSNNMCDDALKSYCGEDEPPPYKKVNLKTYNKTCSCYLSDDYYKKWQTNSISDLTSDQQSYLRSILPPFVSNCSYPLCAAGDAIPLHNSKCTPNEIQVCIDKSTINVEKGVDNSSININSLISCMQNPPSPSQPPSPSPPNKLSMSTIIIVSSISIGLLVLILAFYFLTQK